MHIIPSGKTQRWMLEYLVGCEGSSGECPSLGQSDFLFSKRRHGRAICLLTVDRLIIVGYILQSYISSTCAWCCHCLSMALLIVKFKESMCCNLCRLSLQAGQKHQLYNYRQHNPRITLFCWEESECIICLQLKNLLTKLKEGQLGNVLHRASIQPGERLRCCEF